MLHDDYNWLRVLNDWIQRIATTVIGNDCLDQVIVRPHCVSFFNGHTLACDPHIFEWSISTKKMIPELVITFNTKVGDVFWLSTLTLSSDKIWEFEFTTAITQEDHEKLKPLIVNAQEFFEPYIQLPEDYTFSRPIGDVKVIKLITKMILATKQT